MSNGIIERQNKTEMLDYLAAQRQMYNEAKILGNLIILFSIVLPFVLSILELFFYDNTFLIIYSTASLISMLVAIGLTCFLSHTKEGAAEIQQQFDIYVYKMPWDKRLFGKKKDIRYMVAKKAKKLLKKNCEREKLKNWYTIKVDNLQLEKGILMCQKENYYWDINLRKRFKVASFIIIGIIVGVILVVGIIKNETVVVLLHRLAFVAPMFQWLITTINQISGDIKNLEALGELISDDKPKNMEDLQEIQSKIYVHRKNCFIIPNIFYEIFKDNDENIVNHAISLENDI